MTTRIVAVGSLLVLLIAVTPAEAVSPCCAAFQGEACNQAGEDDMPVGCIELGNGTCIGGGLVESTDPQMQSAIAGCICVGLTEPNLSGCITDSSIGEALNGDRPDFSTSNPRPSNGDFTCTRDAVVGCRGVTGATHPEP